jgi:hypothetical protein
VHVSVRVAAAGRVDIPADVEAVGPVPLVEQRPGAPKQVERCYGGLKQGWWGHGVGDGWQYVAVVITTFGVVTTALAIAFARRITHGRPADVSR